MRFLAVVKRAYMATKRVGCPPKLGASRNWSKSKIVEPDSRTSHADNS